MTTGSQCGVTIGVIGLLSLGCTHSWPHVNVHDDDVEVTIGEPRHWTLDDAHYLLAQMHDRTRGIEIEDLEDLDPNAFNSSRVRHVESVLQLSATYDQFAGEQNKLNLRRLEEADTDARIAKSKVQSIDADLEARHADKLAADLEAAKLQSQIDVEESKKQDLVTREELKKQRRNEIASDLEGQTDGSPEHTRLTALLESADAEIAALGEAKRGVGLEIAKLEAQKAESTNAAVLHEAEIDRLTTARTSAVQASTLSEANFEQAEPAQPIDSPLQTGDTPSNTAFTKAITGLLEDDGIGVTPKLHVTDRILNHIGTETELLARQLTLLRNEAGVDETVVFLELPHSIVTKGWQSRDRIVRVEWSLDGFCDGEPGYRSEEELSGGAGGKEFREAVATWEPLLSFQQNPEERTKRFRPRRMNPADRIAKACSKAAVSEFGGRWKPRAWDLVPKSNAYNTAEFDFESRQFNLAALFSMITGYGATANYARREQIFQQFAQQDVFAAGYGQGMPTFGWLLHPKPGTREVSSGAKSTFATVIVPKTASVVRISSRHCIEVDGTPLLPNRKPSCSQPQQHFVLVENDPKEFWIDEIDYEAIEAGHAGTIIIRGSNFSAFQVSVLVNGHPLKPILDQGSVGRSLANDQGSSAVPIGTYEVTSRTVTINLKMPASYQGTPEITLVTPQRSHRINGFDVDLGIVNGAYTNMDQISYLPMFQKPLTLSSVEDRKIDARPSDRNLLVTGEGFTERTRFTVNNVALGASKVSRLSSSLVVLDVPAADSWTITATKTLGGRDLGVSRSHSASHPTIALTQLNVLGVEQSAADRWNVRLVATGEGLSSRATVTPLSAADSIVRAVVTRQSGAYVEFETGQDNSFLVFEDGDAKAIVAVPIGKQPIVDSVINPKTQKSSGQKEGGYAVVVSGKNLTNAGRVLFGAKAVEPSSRSETTLTVIVPEGTGKVPVVVESSALVDGIKPTSAGSLAYFTYEQ